MKEALMGVARKTGALATILQSMLPPVHCLMRKESSRYGRSIVKMKFGMLLPMTMGFYMSVRTITTCMRSTLPMASSCGSMHLMAVLPPNQQCMIPMCTSVQKINVYMPFLSVQVRCFGHIIPMHQFVLLLG